VPAVRSLTDRTAERSLRNEFDAHPKTKILPTCKLYKCCQLILNKELADRSAFLTKEYTVIKTPGFFETLTFYIRRHPCKEPHSENLFPDLSAPGMSRSSVYVIGLGIFIELIRGSVIRQFGKMPPLLALK